MEVVLDDYGIYPQYAHPGDAGLDLYSSEPVDLGPGESTLVSTGVSVAIPKYHVGFITPRSGLAAKHGITVLNSPGTIDSGYRGELKIILHNTSKVGFYAPAHSRIAQLVVVPFVSVDIEVVHNFSDSTYRGDGGFGSTGV